MTDSHPDSELYEAARQSAERLLKLARSRQHEELIRLLSQFFPPNQCELHISVRPPAAPHLTITGDDVTIWTPLGGTRTATIDDVATVLLLTASPATHCACCGK